MAEQRDYYEILGVARNADPDTIKKAYRKLAMQFHPDKNPGNKEAEDKFKEAASAYEVLSDTNKRAQYDRFGHAAFSQARGGGAGFQNVDDIFANFSDIFGDFFGMGGMGGSSRRQRANQPRKGADLRYITEVSLKEVIEGVEKVVEFDTDENCKDCNGTRAEKGHNPETCSTCKGSGQIVRSQGFFSMASTCPSCQGEGRIIKNPCKTCKGRGRTHVHRKLKVTIPAGVDTGTRLRVSGEGEGGFLNGPTGDLYVEVHVKEDSRFEREGTNLYCHLNCSYLQLLLGSEMQVETVVSKETIEVPRGTQVGDMLKLSGHGLPSVRSGRRGDIYFKVSVEIPQKMTKEEEQLLRQIAEIRKENVAPEGAKFGGFFNKRK